MGAETPLVENGWEGRGDKRRRGESGMGPGSAIKRECEDGAGSGEGRHKRVTPNEKPRCRVAVDKSEKGRPSLLHDH